MTVKKQHFVPKFYLKNFSSNKKNIWVYDKKTNNKFVSSINDIACERFFYDDEILDEIFDKTQHLEIEYSKLESETAPFFQTFLTNISSNDNYKISSEDRKTIANYLVSQIDRTKEHREEVARFTVEIYDKLQEIGISQAQLFQMGFDVEHIDKKELHLESIIAGIERRDSFAELLTDHIWMIYKNETDQSFYTSDNPLVKYGHIKDNLKSNEGYISPGIEIAFPLNPVYILILCDREYFYNYEHLDNSISPINSLSNIKFYNSLQINSCYRQIYSQENKFNLAEEIFKKNK